MSDVDQNTPRGWLRDENRVFLVTVVALTLATSSVLIWRGKRRLDEIDADDRERPSILRAALVTLKLSRLRSDVASNSAKGTVLNAPQRLETSNALDAKALKNSRSKERRRRGKDPLKDIAKSGKKLKELLRQEKRPAPFEDATFVSTDQLGIRAGSGSLSDAGRSATSQSVSDEVTPRLSPVPRDADSHSRSEQGTRAASRTVGNDSRSTSSTRASELESSPPSSDPSDSVIYESTRASPTAVREPSDSASLSSAVAGPSSAAGILLPSPLPTSQSSSWVEITTSPPRRRQGTSRTRVSNGPWDWDEQPSYHRDPPPRFLAANSNYGRSGPSPSPNSTPSLYPLPVLPSDSPGRGVSSPSPFSSPIPSRRTPTPRLPQTPPPNPLSSQTQIASLKGALEAAKMREEKNRLEAERLAKEYEMLRWRWGEDTGQWRRREAEVKGLSVFKQQYEADLLVPATKLHPIPQPESPDVRNAPESTASRWRIEPVFPSLTALPTLPSPQPPSNMAFSPVSPSMQFTYPYLPPYAMAQHPLAAFLPPPAHPNANVSAGREGKSSSSSGSRSPPGEVNGLRGRRRERSGEWIDFDQPQEDGEGEGGREEEDLGLSEEVADAILKRPESLRVKASTRGRVGAGAAREGGRGGRRREGTATVPAVGMGEDVRGFNAGDASGSGDRREAGIGGSTGLNGEDDGALAEAEVEVDVIELERYVTAGPEGEQHAGMSDDATEGLVDGGGVDQEGG
ncbi:hypothetical protein EW146_g4307 [Bondarzewia mesenterica]|uniref:Uncharacterized protein n=1 Tax=Bondarzewia mesenterica TaxID=1095465 RepID=A0A4S4LV24_9AGAM|nr:hypothetical protein EW146_g4307 [Bondarzewia mesenterica]